jgi:SOS-response transcriptional repressor LexA
MVAFITDTIVERGFPPNVREISERLALKSPSTVHKRLVRLTKQGRLVATQHSSKSYYVPPQRDWLAVAVARFDELKEPR